MKGLVSFPGLTKTGIYLDIDVFVNSFADHFSPIVHLRLHSLSSANHFIIAYRKAGHDFVTGILELEGQRSYIDGYGDICIVGIDARCLIDVSILLRHFSIVTGC